MSEEKILDDVSVDNVRAHVEHIVTEIPSRLAGSENGRRMAEYSAQALNEAGAQATVHEIPGLVSFPRKAEFRILSPVEMAIEANTLGHSLMTSGDGISGELLDVRTGAFEEYAGKDSVGRISLSELSYSPARHEKQRIAGLQGCTGAVMMNWGHPGNAAVPFGSVKPVWGNPTPETYKAQMPTIPCIGIARTAGLELREMCEQGPVRVWFRTDVDNGWRPVQFTIGEIPAPAGDDFVLVGGHQDSWYGQASTDNAAGNSCVFELARVFNKYRAELRRGLVFGLWVGHETGTMIGSSWFADRNWDRLREHAVAYMQIDQPACVGTSQWSAHSNAELRSFHEPIERRLLGNRPFVWHQLKKNGDASFMGLGIPMMHAEGGFTKEELADTANANLGWWHHSLDCTIDKVDFAWMADHIRVYAAYLWNLCTAPVLPFRFSSVAEQFTKRLEALASAGRSVGLDGALERARRFGAAAAQLDTCADAWQERYASGATTDDAAADLLNACIKRLSRILVPIQSTAQGTYGHDPYGYTPQTTMIPALYDIPRLAGLAEDSEERWMLETQLVRERNRVVDALGDATALITNTLEGLR